MQCIAFEQSRAAYLGDFAFYASALAGLATVLALDAPRESLAQLAIVAAAGLASWTLLEYVLHRFVLHGLEPFSTWHGEHHRRPAARIGTPTVLSAALVLLMVSAPAFLLAGPWRACALTFGVLAGYFAYSLTHHATHHWRTRNAWFRGRKRWHALHHVPGAQPGCYGVTSAFWDRVFRTGGDARERRRTYAFRTTRR